MLPATYGIQTLRPELHAALSVDDSAPPMTYRDYVYATLFYLGAAALAVCMVAAFVANPEAFAAAFGQAFIIGLVALGRS